MRNHKKKQMFIQRSKPCRPWRINKNMYRFQMPNVICISSFVEKNQTRGGHGRDVVLLRVLPLSGSITASPSSKVESLRSRDAGFPFCPSPLLMWLGSWLVRKPSDSTSEGVRDWGEDDDDSPSCSLAVPRERYSRALSGICKFYDWIINNTKLTLRWMDGKRWKGNLQVSGPSRQAK